MRREPAERVFREIHESRATLADLESAEAVGAGGDADCQVQSEPGLAGLRMAADEADGEMDQRTR